MSTAFFGNYCQCYISKEPQNTVCRIDTNDETECRVSTWHTALVSNIAKFHRDPIISNEQRRLQEELQNTGKSGFSILE